jgi:sulfur carrier protein ThiS
MPAKMILRKKEYKIRSGMTVRSALKKINIHPESVIAIREGNLITDDELVLEDDVIKLIAVISGG